MNYDEWNNYTAIGYLKYAIEHYNDVADANNCQQLTEEGRQLLVGCMKYAFDMKTLKEAYELA